MHAKTAVLFGLSDVLVRLRLDRGLRSLTAYARGNAARPSGPERVFSSPRTIGYQAGLLTPEQFLLGLAQSYGWTDVGFQQLAAAWSDAIDPWPEMANLAEQLVEAGHPTYLFARTDPLHLERARELVPVLRRFTALFPSFETGLAPPAPPYFQRGLDRFGLTAAACVYLDSDPDSVAAAKQVGLPAHLVTDDLDDVRAFLRRWDVAKAA